MGKDRETTLLDKLMTKVLYSTDGQGRWIRREWARQCPEKVFLASQCQGAKGHNDIHWCYKANGDFAWEDNENNPSRGGASGSTPVGHEAYVNPTEKQDDYWGTHYMDTEILDSAVITQLEDGEPPEDGASITRPVDWKKLAKDDPELCEELENRVKFAFEGLTK